MQQKTVLAYSGGLDTSFCIKYLTIEKKLEVIAVLVNTGGFDPDEIHSMESRSIELGAKEFHHIDVTDEFYEKCLRYLVYGNVLRNDVYPLSVSAERVFQALAIARVARDSKARFIAHGSTGAGNDQVRFDMIFMSLLPDVEILTPIRDQRLSRQDEVSYLRKHGIDLDWKKARYSINKGLWGTSVGGRETLTSHQPLPDEAYPTPKTERQSRKITLHFEKGQFSGFNGQKFTHPVQAIRALDALAAPFGIGRDIHVGDTIIGIKGRVGFEAAAPVLIINAHKTLEKHVLSKWQVYWKDQLADWYGMLLHEGQYLEPLMRDIEVFLEHSQQYVSGDVHVQLAAGHFKILGIESPYDLMSAKFGAYGEKNIGWSGTDARGFARIFANANRIYQSVHGEDLP